MNKIFFAGDTSNRTNWGCRATTGMLRRMLEERGTIHWSLDTTSPAARLTPEIVPQEKNKTKKSKASRILDFALKNKEIANAARRCSIRFPRMIQKYRRFLGLACARDYPILAGHIKSGALFPNWKDGLSSCDVVVINGEGSFLENRTPGRLKMLLAYTAKTAFNKPCILINHSADFRNPALRDVAETVYPVLDDAIFRERFSFENSAFLRKDQPFEFAPDVVFKYKPARKECFIEFVNRTDIFSIFPDRWGSLDVSNPYICVGGSSAYFGKNVPGFDPVEQYRALCLELLKVAPVVLTASSEPDDMFFSVLSRDLGLPLLNLRTPTQLAVDVLGNAAAYVGGRWHPGIMALTGGTPVVSFSANTDYKSRGLLDLVGLSQRNPSAFEVGEHAGYFRKIVEEYIRCGDDLRGKLRGIASELSALAENNLRYLS